MFQQSINKRLLAGLKRHNRDFNISLRMAPMIDVIFLLLIFFFVSSQFRPIEDFLPINLPAVEAQTFSVAVVEPLLIYVFDDSDGCSVQIGNSVTSVSSASVAVDMTSLVESLRKVLILQKRTAADPVELIFDNSVKWDYVAKIYNLLFGLGIKDITFRVNE